MVGKGVLHPPTDAPQREHAPHFENPFIAQCDATFINWYL